MSKTDLAFHNKHLLIKKERNKDFSQMHNKSVEVYDDETKKMVETFVSRTKCATAMGLGKSAVCEALKKYKEAMQRYMKDSGAKKPKRRKLTPKTDFNDGKKVFLIDSSKRKT